MDDFRIVPLKLCHVPDNFVEEVKINISRGVALTLLRGSEIIGVGGLCNYWNGVAEAWIQPIASREKLVWMAPSIYKIVKETIAGFHKKYKMHRIHATCPEKFISGRTFLERLNFNAEGILKKYTEDGQDSVMYALTWE